MKNKFKLEVNEVRGNGEKVKLLMGFTVVELALVIAVFLFIVGSTMGIFLSVIKNQRRILAEQQFLNQVSYVEEHVSKALRMAVVDTEGSCLSNPNYIYELPIERYDTNEQYFKGIKFINQTTGACQEFFLENLDPGDFSTPLVLKEKIWDDPNNPSVVITSSNMQINYVRFSINGCDGPGSCYATKPDSAPGIQPWVTMLLSIVVPGDSPIPNSSCLNCSPGSVCDLSTNKCVYPRIIQTTVSERNLNIF